MPKYTTQEIKPTKAIDCVLFEKCGAPVCPVDKCGAWFSDEDICTNAHFQNERLVKNQKKLRKYGAVGIFTIERLKTLSRITKKTTGEKR